MEQAETVGSEVNILLVDDNPAKLLALEAILADLGQNLVKAHSGEEALRYLLNQDFAVILLDVNMPGIDGFETAKLIRSRKRSESTPIIFNSAISQTEAHALKGYSLGAVDYIFTPIPEVLRAKVAVFIELFKKTGEVKRQAEAIRTLNAELEQRVQERTAALRQSEAQLQASLREKEVLLREIYHRVKNNLQVISSLLSLQAESTKDTQTVQILRDAQQRVKSMALVHEKLYKSHDLARINFADYIRTLATDLFRLYRVDARRTTLQIKAQEALLKIDTAIPCGLILQELVSNCLKHAFPDSRAGEITVVLRADTNGQLVLRVRDNGVGFPEGLDFRYTESLGLQLVNLLTRQLNGTIALDRHHGTTFTLTFAEPT